MKTPTSIRRVSGAREEVLEGIGLTVLGEPFTVPADLADKLLHDGTSRFAAAEPQEEEGGSPQLEPARRRKRGDHE